MEPTTTVEAGAGVFPPPPLQPDTAEIEKVLIGPRNAELTTALGWKLPSGTQVKELVLQYRIPAQSLQSNTVAVDCLDESVYKLQKYCIEEEFVSGASVIEGDEKLNELWLRAHRKMVECESLKSESSVSAQTREAIEKLPKQVVGEPGKFGPLTMLLSRKAGAAEVPQYLHELNALSVSAAANATAAEARAAKAVEELRQELEHLKEQLRKKLVGERSVLMREGSTWSMGIYDYLDLRIPSWTLSLTMQHAVTAAAADQPCILPFTLRYVDNGASWSPAYEFRTVPGASPDEPRTVEVSYFAMVQQRTKQPWNNVAIELNTNSCPKAHPPALPRLVGRLEEPPKPAAMTMAAHGGMRNTSREVARYPASRIMMTMAAMPAAAPGGAMAAAPQDGSAADSADMGFSLEEGEMLESAAVGTDDCVMNIMSSDSLVASGARAPSILSLDPETFDVPNDNEPHKLLIGTATIDCTLVNLCVPDCGNTAVHRMALMRNSTEFVLMPCHNIPMIWDGVFAGTENISDPVAPSGELLCRFGVNKNLKVIRGPTKDVAGNKGNILMGQKNRDRKSQVVTAENAGSVATEVCVIAFRVPESRNAQIKVTIENISKIEETAHPSDLRVLADCLDKLTIKKPQTQVVHWLHNTETGNLLAICQILPKEKIDVQLTYAIEYPTDKKIEIV